MNSLGVESPSPLNRSYTSISTSTYSTPSSTPVNRAISRVALQPSTPVVVPPSPSPAAGAGSSSTANGHSTAMNGGSAHGNGGSRLAIGSTSGSSSGLSPSTSSQDLVSDAEEAERQTNRRSMYRSPGTSSSPDLATLLRKTKERSGSGSGAAGDGVGGSGAASGSGSNGMRQGRRERRRDDPHPPLPDQTLRGHPTSHSHSSATLVASPSAYPSDMGVGIERSPDWVHASPKQQRENGTIKVCNGGPPVSEC